MTKPKLTIAAALTLVLTFHLSSSVRASTPIDIEKVPEIVQQTAALYTSGLSFLQAFSESHDGIVRYELRYQDGKKGWIEFDFDAKGRLLEKETQVTLDQVPAAVKQALKRHAPNFKPNLENIEKSERPHVQANGHLTYIIWYEFDEGTDKEGDKVDVEIDEGGNRVLFEVESHQR